MKISYQLAAITIAATAIGCASVRAPVRPDGSRIAIVVHVDRGDQASMNEGQWNKRLQVGTWMENDLVNILNRSGYAARLVTKKDEYSPAAGSYLLAVGITSYNPGSKAARMMVGYGAGATSLDAKYELVEAAGSSPVGTGSFSVGSGRDWNYCARTINVRIARAITAKLNEAGAGK